MCIYTHIHIHKYIFDCDVLSHEFTRSAFDQVGVDIINLILRNPSFKAERKRKVERERGRERKRNTRKLTTLLSVSFQLQLNISQVRFTGILPPNSLDRFSLFSTRFNSVNSGRERGGLKDPPRILMGSFRIC